MATTLFSVDIPLPKEFQHLCKTRGQVGKEGHLNVRMNRTVMEQMAKFQADLMRSRRLPTNPNQVSFSDPVVLRLVQDYKDELAESDVLPYARAWYQEQIEQAGSDAALLAMTLYNDISSELVPSPYEDGEIAFKLREGDADSDDLPDWVQERASIDIPPPVRDLRNTYERQLKIRYDLSVKCGMPFLRALMSGIENGMISGMMEAATPRDEDGFHPERVGGAVSVPNATDTGNNGA